MALDDMEYSTDAHAAAAFAGTGCTVTKSTTKQEGNYALQVVVDGTGNRTISKSQTLNLSGFKVLKIWERVDVASSAIQFFVHDSLGNESYWDITTNGTQDTWQEDELDLTTPDSNSGTAADLDLVTSWGFKGLDASKTYIIDTVKAFCGLNVAVDTAIVGGFYQQAYCGVNRISFVGGASPAITPPASNPRIDLLALTAAGGLEWTPGAESSTPAEPVFPANKIPVCLVYCKVTMTKVVDYEDASANPNEAYIYKDVRPLFGIQAIVES
jgi:hypothetical protein